MKATMSIFMKRKTLLTNLLPYTAFLYCLFFSFSISTLPAQTMDLYGVIGNELVSINTTTALATSVGAFNNALTPVSNLAYHPGTGQLLGVSTSTSAPNLVELDPITGAATVIAPIVLSPTNTVAGLLEGLAYNPADGLLYAAIDSLSPPTSFRSYIFVTIDPATAIATKIADISGTCNQEADAMIWNNGSMFTTDGCPNPNNFYKVNPLTGFSTFIGVTGVLGVGDFAFNTLTNLQYGYDTNRQLWTIDTTNANISVIGNTHTAADFAGQFLRGIAFVPGIVMPRNFRRWEAWPEGDANQLYWELHEEIGYAGYIVERSLDGEVFEKIGNYRKNKVKQAYSFSDRETSMIKETQVFYRIKALLDNGGEVLSSVIEVHRDGAAEYLHKLYPNPLAQNQNLNLDFVSQDSRSADLEIRDVQGRLIWTGQENLIEGMNRLALILPDLKAGIYFLQIQTISGKNVRRFFVE